MYLIATSAISTYQSQDRVSVRLAARTSSQEHDSPTTIANDQLQLHASKRSSEDKGDPKRGANKKRKKSTQVINTSNPLANLDRGFTIPTIPFSHFPYTAAGTTHSLQVSYDYPNFPRAPYPPPPPPYNYYTMSSNMVPRSQLVADIQMARCMSSRYKMDAFPRCVSCTRRWAGDTCRFQGIRYVKPPSELFFYIPKYFCRFFLRDTDRRIGGVSFVDSQVEELPKMNFPDSWNISLDFDKINLLKV